MDQYEKLMTEIYDELDKKDAYPQRAYYDLFVNNSKFDKLEEHSLWTYWQGRGVRHPKIMVVGQDWGSIKQSEKYYEYIKKHPDAKVVSYEQIREENPGLVKSEFTTDKELQRFFREYLGYPDICKNHYDDIYFTNLIPGYRDGKQSTGSSEEAQKGVTPRVIEDFKNILEMLKPEFVICLGRIVGESIAEAYDKKNAITSVGGFNEFLDVELNKENPQPIELDLGEGHHAKMFVISHLGSLGKANRKRYFNKKEIEKTVESDWKVVGDYIGRYDDNRGSNIEDNRENIINH